MLDRAVKSTWKIPSCDAHIGYCCLGAPDPLRSLLAGGERAPRMGNCGSARHRAGDLAKVNAGMYPMESTDGQITDSVLSLVLKKKVPTHPSRGSCVRQLRAVAIASPPF